MFYRQLLVGRNLLLWYVAAFFALATAVDTANLLQHTKHEALGTFDAMLSAQAWAVGLIATVYGAVFGSALRQNARVWWVLPKSRLSIAGIVVFTDLAYLFLTLIAGSTVFIATLVPMAGADAIAHAFSAVTVHGVLLPLGFIAAAYAFAAVFGLLVRAFPWASIATIPLLTLLNFVAKIGGGVGWLMDHMRLVNPEALYVAAYNPAYGGVLSSVTTSEFIALLWLCAAGGLAIALTIWQRSDVVAV